MNEKIDKQSMWENLVERIRSWTNSASEKAGEITRTATTKAEEWSKVGRLKVDIYQLQREQARLYTDLGQIAFNIMDGKEKDSLEAHAGAADLQKRITAIKAEISRKEKEIEEAAQEEEMATKKEDSPASTTTTEAKPKATPRKKPAAQKPAEKQETGKASTAASKKTPAAGTKKTTGGAKKKSSTTTRKAPPKKKSGSSSTKTT
ncbi:hypothetical protein ACFL4U_03530 [Candidatus Neomarinimicrobiota bacterium]